jgi:hypothetical protein
MCPENGFFVISKAENAVISGSFRLNTTDGSLSPLAQTAVICDRARTLDGWCRMRGSWRPDVPRPLNMSLRMKRRDAPNPSQSDPGVQSWARWRGVRGGAGGPGAGPSGVQRPGIGGASTHRRLGHRRRDAREPSVRITPGLTKYCSSASPTPAPPVVPLDVLDNTLTPPAAPAPCGESAPSGPRTRRLLRRLATATTLQPAERPSPRARSRGSTNARNPLALFCARIPGRSTRTWANRPMASPTSHIPASKAARNDLVRDA